MLRAIAVATTLALPVAAQDLPDLDAVASQATDLATEVAEAAADRVLVADMLGRDVIGPDGAVLGTLDDLVVLPGGNLVAAVIARPEGRPVALPWDAAKAGVAAGEPVEIPFTGAELDGAQALRDLTDALGVGGDG